MDKAGLSKSAGKDRTRKNRSRKYENDITIESCRVKVFSVESHIFIYITKKYCKLSRNCCRDRRTETVIIAERLENNVATINKDRFTWPLASEILAGKAALWVTSLQS